MTTDTQQAFHTAEVSASEITQTASAKEIEVGELLKQAFYAEERNIALVDELLYELHRLMAGNGREGVFSRYLRETLGWTSPRPDKIARRRIARHKHRKGLITHEEYQRAMGNAPTSAPLRPASELPTEDGLPSGDETSFATVESTESFEFEVTEDTEVALLEPGHVTQEETSAATMAMNRLGTDTASVMLQRRIVMPAAKLAWLKSGLKLQMQRHKAATFSELIWKLVLCGSKAAEPGDEWGETHDEILRQVGHNPELAFLPDPDYDDWQEDEN